MSIPGDFSYPIDLEDVDPSVASEKITNCRFHLEFNEKNEPELIFTFNENGVEKEYFYQSKEKLKKILNQRSGDTSKQKQALVHHATKALELILDVKRLNNGKDYKEVFIKKTKRWMSSKIKLAFETAQEDLKVKLNQYQDESELLNRFQALSSSSKILKKLEKKGFFKSIQQAFKGLETSKSSLPTEEAKSLVDLNQKFLTELQGSSLRNEDEKYLLLPKKFKDYLERNYSLNFQKKWKKQIKPLASDYQNTPQTIPCSYASSDIPCTTYGSLRDKLDLVEGHFNGTSTRDVEVEGDLHPKSPHLVGMSHFKARKKQIYAHGFVQSSEQKTQLKKMLEAKPPMGISASGKPRYRLCASSLLNGFEGKEVKMNQSHRTYIQDLNGKELDDENPLETVFLHLPTNIASKSSQLDATYITSETRILENPYKFLKSKVQSLISKLSPSLYKSYALSGGNQQDSQSDIDNEKTWNQYMQWSTEEITSLLDNLPTERREKEIRPLKGGLRLLKAMLEETLDEKEQKLVKDLVIKHQANKYGSLIHTNTLDSEEEDAAYGPIKEEDFLTLSNKDKAHLFLRVLFEKSFLDYKNSFNSRKGIPDSHASTLEHLYQIFSATLKLTLSKNTEMAESDYLKYSKTSSSDALEQGVNELIKNFNMCIYKALEKKISTLSLKDLENPEQKKALMDAVKDHWIRQKGSLDITTSELLSIRFQDSLRDFTASCKSKNRIKEILKSKQLNINDLRNDLERQSVNQSKAREICRYISNCRKHNKTIKFTEMNIDNITMFSNLPSVKKALFSERVIQNASISTKYEKELQDLYRSNRQRVMEHAEHMLDFTKQSSREQQRFLLSQLNDLLGVSETLNCKSSCDRTSLPLSQTLAIEQIKQNFPESEKDLHDAILHFDQYSQDILTVFQEECKQLAKLSGETDKNKQRDRQIELFEDTIQHYKEHGPKGKFLAYQIQLATLNNLLTTCNARNIRSTGLPGLKLNTQKWGAKSINPHLLRLLPPYIRLEGEKTILLKEIKFKDEGKKIQMGITQEALTLLEGAAFLRGS